MKTKPAISIPRAGHKAIRLFVPATPSLRACGGLTVLEMLVSTACLLFIVIGLTAMFVETQRAFKAGIKQTTMTDSGHTVLDMVAGDLAQLSDAQNPNIVNLYWGWVGVSSYNYQDSTANIYRTNQLQEIFALIHTNTQWVGVGYAVSNYANGAGILYRYEAITNDPLISAFSTNNALFNNFLLGIQNQNFNPTNFHRITDGVVHFKIRTFDQMGNENPFEQGNDYNTGTINFSYPITNYAYYSAGVGSPQISVPQAGLPSMIQLEVGVLEPEATEQLRNLPATAQAAYLGKSGGKIQIYRQNIPIAAATR